MYERVLVDTSAIYALISASDNYHQRARRVYEGLIDRETELYTTSYVLVETAALVHHRLGFEPLKAFVESTKDVLEVYWVDRATHAEAWKLMVARGGSGLSLVDWTTYVVAGNLKASVFAFDQDFVQEGLTVLP